MQGLLKNLSGLCQRDGSLMVGKLPLDIVPERLLIICTVQLQGRDSVLGDHEAQNKHRKVTYNRSNNLSI